MVYRLYLKPPLFLALIQPVIALFPWIKARSPEWFLPPIVILKKQKLDWEEEFHIEKKAYAHLKPIQGTVIPYFYGEVVYDASPTLVLSAIARTTLSELARDKFPKSKDDALEEQLAKALRALTSYGVKYIDAKRDNFLVADDGQVMIVDFEQVEFHTTKVWEESTNHRSVGSLMRYFKRTRESYAQFYGTEQYTAS